MLVTTKGKTQLLKLGVKKGALTVEESGSRVGLRSQRSETPFRVARAASKARKGAPVTGVGREAASAFPSTRCQSAARGAGMRIAGAGGNDDVNGTAIPVVWAAEEEPGVPSPLHLFSTSAAASLGLVLNAYILTVLLWQRQFRTANSLLLLHLAFVDSVFCVIVLVSNGAFALLGGEFVVRGGCQTHGTLWSAVTALLVWTLCGLSCDRYAAIASPLHYSRLVNTRRTCFFLLTSWVLALCVALPPLAGVCPYEYRPVRCVCVATCTGDGPWQLAYALGYVWLAFVFPASLIAACSFQVLLIARTHRHRIVAAIYEVN